MWTKFWDMHSGGSTKEPPFSKIYIEAPEAEAKAVFYSRFGHNPDRVTCTCCGEDYSITEEESLAEATAYARGLQFIKPEWADRVRWSELTTEQREQANSESRYLEVDEEMPEGFVIGNAYISTTPQTVEQYLEHDDVMAIYAADIADSERTATVPEQGYVWQD